MNTRVLEQGSFASDLHRVDINPLLWIRWILLSKAKIPLVHNPNVNDECEWWMLLGNQCSVCFVQCVLLCCGPLYEGISCPTKHSHSHHSLHALFHFVACTVRIRIRMNGITHSHSSFAFVIRIMHKWNLSLNADLLCGLAGRASASCEGLCVINSRPYQVSRLFLLSMHSDNSSQAPIWLIGGNPI